VGSSLYGLGKPLGYFSSAIFCQYSKLNGTFNNAVFVLYNPG
jgi:hypothetical protein